MTIATRADLSIEHFESADIDAEKFDHAAHLYVAWLYVNRFELPIAIARFDAALKRLVKKLGAEDKYHATLTWFFMLLIAERHEKTDSWSDFCRNNPDLTQQSRDVLSRYYSADHLFSDRARQRFLLPDSLAANGPAV